MYGWVEIKHLFSLINGIIASYVSQSHCTRSTFGRNLWTTLSFFQSNIFFLSMLIIFQDQSLISHFRSKFQLVYASFHLLFMFIKQEKQCMTHFIWNEAQFDFLAKKRYDAISLIINSTLVENTYKQNCIRNWTVDKFLYLLLFFKKIRIVEDCTWYTCIQPE